MQWLTLSEYRVEMYRSFVWPKHSADTEAEASVSASVVITSNSAEVSAKFGTIFRTTSVYFLLIICIARINVWVNDAFPKISLGIAGLAVGLGIVRRRVF
jgi:hypothetical protein